MQRGAKLVHKGTRDNSAVDVYQCDECGTKYLSSIDKNNDYEIEINEEEQGFKLIKNLIENNINVIKFEMKKPSLNDIFIEKVGK